MLEHLKQSSITSFGVVRGRPSSIDKNGKLMCDYSSVDIARVIQVTKPKQIFIALGVSSIKQAESNLQSIADVTTIIERILLEISLYAPNSNVFLASSGSICGQSSDVGIVESVKHSPISAYGTHKANLENLAINLSSEHKLNLCIIRIFSIHGFFQKRHIVWEVFTQLSRGDKVKLYGDGTEVRDFIEINDLATQIIFLLQFSGQLPEVVNLGSGNPTQILQLASFVRDFCNPRASILFDGKRNASDPVYLYPDLTLARSLGVPAGKSLTHGLHKTLEEWKKYANLANR